MSGILAEILRAINDVALATEIVNTMWDAFCIDVFLGTGAKVFLLRHALGVLDAIFEHFARLLTQFRVLLVAGLEVLLPAGFNVRAHDRIALL